ncbi:MAG TPA: phenylphosphate carboxylase subunit delta [Thermoanaerobaculia bacterium]
MTDSIVTSDEALARHARALEWILLDVDGVLTDGRLVYGPEGEQWKTFDVRDGIGLKLSQKAGLKVGILSGRLSEALRFRAGELGLDALIMDRPEKASAFAEFLTAHNTAPGKVAYMGDDLLDLPVILRCGLSFAPSDAAPEVRERVHRVVGHRGGRGAVREMCEILLRARGDWEKILATFLHTSDEAAASA